MEIASTVMNAEMNWIFLAMLQGFSEIIRRFVGFLKILRNSLKSFNDYLMMYRSLRDSGDPGNSSRLLEIIWSLFGILLSYLWTRMNETSLKIGNGKKLIGDKK